MIKEGGVVMIFAVKTKVASMVEVIRLQDVAVGGIVPAVKGPVLDGDSKANY